MGSLKVYVDSSFRGKDCKCQAGFIYTNPVTKRVYMESSSIFFCDNNNDSEIYGIYLAVKEINKRHGFTDFLVYNDSIIGCSMMDSRCGVSKSVDKKHPLLKELKKDLKECGITIKTQKLDRKDKTIKLCDKLSKKFRR